MEWPECIECAENVLQAGGCTDPNFVPSSFRSAICINSSTLVGIVAYFGGNGAWCFIVVFSFLRF